MPVEKEIVVSLDDLNRLEIVCPQCHSSLTLGKDAGAVEGCAACGLLLTTQATVILQAYRRMMREYPGDSWKFQFRIAVKD